MADFYLFAWFCLVSKIALLSICFQPYWRQTNLTGISPDVRLLLHMAANNFYHLLYCVS